MSSSASGRKRQAPSAPVYSPNETLNKMNKEFEARDQAKSTAQREARAIRAAKEMERQRKEEDDGDDRDYTTTNTGNYYTNSNGTSVSNSAAAAAANRYARTSTTTSSTGATNGSASNHISSTSSTIPISSSSKSRFITSSTKSTSDANDIQNGDDNPRELKKKLAEMEDKYNKHAIYQTELENDKQKLIYEVDFLKDLIEEHEEILIEIRRQYKEKSRELENQKREYKDLSTDFERLKDILKQRDKLIEESGLILYTDNDSTATMNGSKNDIKSILPAALVSSDTAKLLDGLGDGTIDDKLKRLLNDKHHLKEQITKLKADLEDEHLRSENLERKLAQSTSKLNDTHDNSQELQEIQRTLTKEIADLKMKYQKVDHENVLLKQEKTRLESQVKNLQTSVHDLELKEEQLIIDKREMKREYQELKTKYDDAILENQRLQNRFDSLEFYARTNTNSNAFHNLQAATANSNQNTATLNGGQNRGERGVTPMPQSRRSSVTRQPDGLLTPSSYSSSSSSSNYRAPSVERQLPPIPTSSYSSARPVSMHQPSTERTLSSSSNYDTSRYMSRPTMNGRQSVERTLPSTSSYGVYDKPPIYGTSSLAHHGRVPSTSNIYRPESTSNRYSTYVPSASTSYYYPSGNKYKSHYDGYLSDSNDFINTDSIRMRRRDKSTDRSTTNSALLKLRRKSYADTSKYYY